VEPYQRLKLEQVEQIHRASLAILTDPGVVCFNRSAAEVFGDHGAEVLPSQQGSAACWLLKIPEKVITDALQSAPQAPRLTTGWRWMSRLLSVSVIQTLRLSSPCSG